MPQSNFPAAKEEKPENNGFLIVLQRKEMQHGTLTELSEKLSEAARAAALTNKKAKVCLELVIEPKQGALNILSNIKSTIPADPENLCLFFIDENGQLTRNDPNQKEFAFRPVDGGKTETPAPAAEKAAQ